MRNSLRLFLFPLALMTVAACGPSTAPDDGHAADGGTDVAALSDGSFSDAEAAAPVDAGNETGASDVPLSGDGATVADAAGGDADPDAAGSATLFGQVGRSAVNSNGADGRGDLYIAVFTEDPITASATAMRVGQQVIRNVDLSTPSARVDYRITGIPPRPQPYYVSAVLDDNMDITPTAPRPDRGDSLNGITPPTVTLDSASEQMFDIDLSFVLPFDV